MVTRAWEIPPAIIFGSPVPNKVICWKVTIIPVTVPRSPAKGATTEIDNVSLVITSGAHKKVITSITKAINAASFGDNSGLIVVCDALAGVFADSDITDCVITHDS